MLAFIALTLAFAVSLALGADVVAKHGSEDEVLFGRQLIEWTSNEQTDGIETFATTEIDIHVLFASALHHVVYRLAAQTMAGYLLCVENDFTCPRRSF